MHTSPIASAMTRPRRQGRVTLNPLAHADPIGTVALPLLTAVFSSAATGGSSGGFGWGRPVETTPRQYTRRFSMDTGQALVAIAGPAMNVLLAIVFALLHVILLSLGIISAASHFNMALVLAVGMNFSLFFFNLIPVPPLDGGWIARRFVSARHAGTFEKIAAYGPFIILAIVMIPVLSLVISVPARFCRDGLYSGLFALFGI